MDDDLGISRLPLLVAKLLGEDRPLRSPGGEECRFSPATYAWSRRRLRHERVMQNAKILTLPNALRFFRRRKKRTRMRVASASIPT